MTLKSHNILFTECNKPRKSLAKLGWNLSLFFSRENKTKTAQNGRATKRNGKIHKIWNTIPNITGNMLHTQNIALLYYSSSIRKIDLEHWDHKNREYVRTCLCVFCRAFSVCVSFSFFTFHIFRCHLTTIVAVSSAMVCTFDVTFAKRKLILLFLLSKKKETKYLEFGSNVKDKSLHFTSHIQCFHNFVIFFGLCACMCRKRTRYHSSIPFCTLTKLWLCHKIFFYEIFFTGS